MAAMIQQVYIAQNLPPPNITVTATAPTTATAIIELICPAGKFFPPGTNTSECLLCPAGKFQTGVGKEVCKGRAPCAPGTYLSREDTAGNAAPPDLCSACPAGKMSLESDVENCTECAAGQYQPESGTVFCNACPPHATTDGGAANALDCKCEPNYFMVANGTWIKGVWEQLSRPQCQQCVVGADCSAVGMTVDSLRTKPGFWRAGIATVHFDELSCDESTCTGGVFGQVPPPAPAPAPAGGAVAVSSQGSGSRALQSVRTFTKEPADAQCAPGQSGLMCSLCDLDNRWARHMGKKCIKCAGDISSEMVKIIGVLSGLCVFAWLVTKRVIRPLIRRLLKKMTLTQLRKAIYKRQMKVKILLAFVQVGSRLQGTFRLKMPSMAKQLFAQLQFLEFFDVFSMILKNASCAYPTDYYTKVYVQTIGPLVALGLLYFAFLKTREPAFFDLLLFVSFVVYPSSSGVLIQFFDCYPVWPGAPGSTMKNYLLMDPSIQCTDDKWITTALIYVLPMTAIFVVGFPAYYGKLVFGDRKLINPNCPNQRSFNRIRSIQSKCIPSQAALQLALGDYLGMHLEAAELDVLFSHWSGAGAHRQGAKTPVAYVRLLELFEYGQSYERWHKTAEARNEGEHSAGMVIADPPPVLHSAPSALREKLQSHAIRAYQALVTKSKPDKERWAIRAREGDDRAQRSAFLWKAYRPKFFWFEVFDMFRKFLLTGLPLILNSLFPNSDELSLAIGLLASMLGMAAYAAASPFADNQDSLLMLPAQMQVTLVMVCGMLMNFVDGDPVGQALIAMVIILSCLPILAFGCYLIWNPDFDAMAYVSGGAVTKILGPFLDRAERVADKAIAKVEKGATKVLDKAEKGASALALSSEEADSVQQARKKVKDDAKQAKLRAVQLAIELIMNPNLDPLEDIRRLGGESAELVMKIVNRVKPLVEAGSPSVEDIAEMVESLFEVCSGTAAKHSSRIVEMMAVKGLRLAGVVRGHAIEEAVRGAVGQIGKPGSAFESFGEFYDAMLPVVQGAVSEEEVMQLFELLGIDKLVVAQALLPALFRKSLALAGIPKDVVASMGERIDKAAGSWTPVVFEDAKRAIGDCLDGDITLGDLENLLALAGMSKEEAYAMAATHMLQRAMVMVLPGRESKAMVTRVVAKIRDTLQATGATDPGFVAKVKALLMESTEMETRSAAVYDLLRLVGESFESVAGQIIPPLANNALLRAGFCIDSPVAVRATEGVKLLLKDPAAAKGKLNELMAQCKIILDSGMDLTEAVELLPNLLGLVGIDVTTAKLAALELALERVCAVVGLEMGAPMLKAVGATLKKLTDQPAHVEALFSDIYALVKDLAAAVASFDAEAAVIAVLTVLLVFGIDLQTGMKGLLPAMLTRVLNSLDITDPRVVGTCLRTMATLVVDNDEGGHGPQAGADDSEGPQVTLASRKDAAKAFVGGMADHHSGLLRTVMDSLALAVLSFQDVPDAAPFTVDQALKLLDTMGVSPQDALLDTLSGTYLRNALQQAGVPATHAFQKEARGIVLAVSTCPEDQRQAKIGILKAALEVAADAVHGGSPAPALVGALSALGANEKSMAMVMAPLVAQAGLRTAGIPQDHDIMQRVDHASRAVVVHAKSFEQACEMVGVDVPMGVGSIGVGSEAAALRVVLKLGIPATMLQKAMGEAAEADAVAEGSKVVRRVSRAIFEPADEPAPAPEAKVAAAQRRRSVGGWRGQYKVAPAAAGGESAAPTPGPRASLLSSESTEASESTGHQFVPAQLDRDIPAIVDERGGGSGGDVADGANIRDMDEMVPPPLSGATGATEAGQAAEAAGAVEAVAPTDSHARDAGGVYPLPPLRDTSSSPLPELGTIATDV
jgi:hypothetical protein